MKLFVLSRIYFPRIKLQILGEHKSFFWKAFSELKTTVPNCEEVPQNAITLEVFLHLLQKLEMKIFSHSFTNLCWDWRQLSGGVPLCWETGATDNWYRYWLESSRHFNISTITLYNRDKMCNDLAWGNYERSLVTALMIIEWTSPCVQVCLQVSVVEQKICSFNSCKSHFLVSLKYDFVMIKYLSWRNGAEELRKKTCRLLECLLYW